MKKFTQEGGQSLLLVVDSHPISYKVPLYKKLTNIPGLFVTVMFYDKFGVNPYFDQQWGFTLEWDTKFLDGYQYEFLRNYAPNPSPYGFFGAVNPGLFTRIKRGHFDAVLINGYARASDWIALLSAWANRIPVIFRGEADLLKPTTSFRRIVKKLVLPILFRHCDAILYSCESNAAFFRHYGVPQEKLFFAPCAVDNEFFREQARVLGPQRERLRSELGIPARAVVALYVGRLTKRKRVLDIVMAFHRQAASNTWLVIVGDGPEKGVLLDYINRFQVKNLVFAGFKNRSEISQMYVLADMLIVASEYDPSPKVINEAMNFGLPIIASDRVGTAGDLVRPGENGFVYPVGDVDALADCMERLYTDQNLRQRMGARSLEIVSQWNFDKQAEAVMSALKYIEEKRRR